MFRAFFIFIFFLFCFDAYAFALTIEHKFGTTVIDHEPKRVASLDFAGADDLLALGVQPVTVRSWLCPKGPYSICPWAQHLLKSEPLVLGRNIDFEAIAKSKPDLIIALASGIDNKDYEKLSKIAPVVGPIIGSDDYALKWQDRTLITGKLLGREKRAKDLVDEVEAKLDKFRNSRWLNKSVAVAYFSKSSFGMFTEKDASMQIMKGLGFVMPSGLVNKSSSYFLPLSEEQIDLIDADLLIWINAGAKSLPLSDLAGYEFLKAHQEGREIMLDADLNSAFRQATILSIPYAVDRLIPEIEKTLRNE